MEKKRELDAQQRRPRPPMTRPQSADSFASIRTHVSSFRFLRGQSPFDRPSSGLHRPRTPSWKIPRFNPKAPHRRLPPVLPPPSPTRQPPSLIPVRTPPRAAETAAAGSSPSPSSRLSAASFSSRCRAIPWNHWPPSSCWSSCSASP